MDHLNNIQNSQASCRAGNTINIPESALFAGNVRNQKFFQNDYSPQLEKKQRHQFLTPSPRDQNRFTIKIMAQQSNHQFFKSNLGIDARSCSPPKKGSKRGNKDKVRENLILLAMEQMNEVIDEKVTISKVLEQNKLIWMRSMIRMKGIQSIINQFQTEIKAQIIQEFKKNEDKIQRFMKVSRPPDLTILNSAQFIQSCQGSFDGEERNREKVRRDQKFLREVTAQKKVKIRTGPAPSNPRYKSSNNRVNYSSQNSSRESLDQNQSSGNQSSLRENSREDKFQTAKFRFHKGMRLLRSFKQPKAANEQSNKEAKDPSLMSDINYHQLATQVKNTDDLVTIVKENLFPKDLPENVKPTDQWLESMAKENKALMNSFTFKKKLLTEFHDKIWQEIRRKQKVMEMGEALKKFEDRVNVLNNDACALFHNRDENQIRAKQPPLIKNFYNCFKIEPHKAEMMVKSRAIEFMNKWYSEPVQDHSETIKKWKGIWEINENFEIDIMNEIKGHHLDLRQVVLQNHLKYTTLMSKVDLRLQASEMALNQAKLDYLNRLNQLEMIDQDRQSEELRQFYKKKEAGGAAACEEKMESLINGLRPTKFQNLKSATDMLEKIKIACRDYIIQQKEHNKALSSLKFEFETAASKIKRLEEENKAKNMMFEWVHDLTVLGSLPSAPRAMLTQEAKKRLDLFKQECLPKQHAELLQEQEIFQKLTAEIQMSKILSIVTFNIFQIFNELSLFQSSEKFIRKNAKKFSMSGDQLFEIWNLFKSEPVQQQMTILNKNRAEMIKFRAKMGEQAQRDQEEVETDGGMQKGKEDADKRKEAYFKRIQNEFNNLKESDFAVNRALIKPLVKPFKLLMMEEDQILQINKSDQLLEKINGLLVDESQSENEFAAHFIKFHDLIKLDESTLRVQLDPIKFPLFVKENMEQLQPVEGEGQEKQESDIHNQLSMVVESARAINSLLSGKAYDKAVQFKPGRRLVEEFPLRGYIYLAAHSSRAPQKEVQCQILDAASIESKIEKKLQRAFELKIDKFKNRNKELEDKISKLKQSLKEQESKLLENGVQFETKQKPDESESHSLKESEKSEPGVKMLLDDDLTDLYGDIKKMTSVFSGEPGASRSLNINDLDNLAVFQQKIHNLDIFKRMTSSDEGQQIPLVTQKTKLIARKSFEKDTIGAVIMQALQKQIKKTIKKIALEQDLGDMPNISPNQPSRHTIKIANRSAFSTTPLGSDFEESSQSDSDYSLSSNGQGESIVRMTRKPKKGIRGKFKDSQIQTEFTGEFRGSRPKDKNIVSEQFTTGQTYRQDQDRDDSSRPEATNTDMIIEEQITGRTLLDDASKIRQNNGSLSSDLKHIDKIDVGKWAGTQAKSTSLSKGFDPSFSDALNDENMTTIEMKLKCKQLISSFEMDQILIKDKFQIFPQQKKLRPGQYHNMKEKLEELQRVQDTLSARKHMENISQQQKNQKAQAIKSISPRQPLNSSNVMVQLDEGLSQTLKQQNLNPRFNVKTQFRRVKTGSKLAQSLNVSRAFQKGQMTKSPRSSYKVSKYVKSSQEITQEHPNPNKGRTDVCCSPIDTSIEFGGSRLTHKMKVGDVLGDKEESSIDVEECNAPYLDTIPSINQERVETKSTLYDNESHKKTRKQFQQAKSPPYEPKRVNFYQYPASHIRNMDGSTISKKQRNDDIKNVKKLLQNRNIRKIPKKVSETKDPCLKESKAVAQEFIINIEEARDSQADEHKNNHNSSIQDKAMTEHVDTPKDGVVIMPLRKKPSAKKLVDFNPNYQSLTFKPSEEAPSVPEETLKKAGDSKSPQEHQVTAQVDNSWVISNLKKSDMSLLSHLSAKGERNHLEYGVKQVRTTKNHSRPQFSSQTGPGLSQDSNQQEIQSRPSGMRQGLLGYHKDKSSLFVRNMSPQSDMQMIGSSYHLMQKVRGSPNKHSPDEKQDWVLYANQKPEHYLSNIAPKSPDFSSVDMNVPPSLLRRDLKKIEKKKSEALYCSIPSKQIEYGGVKQKQQRNNLKMQNANDGQRTQQISCLLRKNVHQRDRNVVSKSTVSSPLSFS